MATESEGFGRYVVEINVSVEIKDGDGWLCCSWNYMRLFWVGKVAQDWRNRWAWCQVLEGVFDALGVIDELKSPCGGRGFR